jgi:hypothetical protein
MRLPVDLVVDVRSEVGSLGPGDEAKPNSATSLVCR